MLFRNPSQIIEARSGAEVLPAFSAIEEKLAQGFHLAGYIAYEAGLALEPALADLVSTLPNGEPLVWLGCYGPPEICQDPFSSDVALHGAEPVRLRYSLAQEEYERKVEIVRGLIAAGETYQANLTMDAEWETGEHPTAMYDRLLRAQPVPYSGLLHPQSGWHILSFSPELFFERRKDHIVTRPMKGTAAPGRDAKETRAQAEWLRADEKNRAENVMIVDLMRSDLGRICQSGSVQVTQLFAVESYPTVLQMTSTVEGKLRHDVRYTDLFRALFPCGSIVGAPKIHTMRLLHALEERQRGVYAGAIGYIAPGGEAEFNVAIRTVSLHNRKARLGVGSGITFDSQPQHEYAECLTKTTFLTQEPVPEFQLIETLLLHQGTFTFLEEHVERLAQSAEYFDFLFSQTCARTALEDAARSWKTAGPARVRMLLDRQGMVTCKTSSLHSANEGSGALLLWLEHTVASDRFLRHKTTHRALYDTAHRQAQARGFADSLFSNSYHEITEGAIHNVIARIAGEWITPPLESGVLPGIYRSHLLEQGKVSERVLPLSDLLQADQILFCNSVRGLRRATSIAAQSDKSSVAETLWIDKIFPHNEDGHPLVGPAEIFISPSR